MNNLSEHIPSEFLKPSEGFRNAILSMGLHYWYLSSREQKVILDPELFSKLSVSGEKFSEILKNLLLHVHPDERKLVRERYDHLLKGTSQVLELDIRLKINNSWVWYYVRGTIIDKDKNGDPQIIGGIAMDMSSRYSRMLEKIEGTKKFEFTFHNTTQPLVIGTIRTDSEPGRITEVNDAVCQLMQCKREDLIGRQPFDLISNAKDGDDELIIKQLRTKGVFQWEVQIETLRREPRHIFISSHAFTEAGRKLFIAVISDKTENKMIREELKASEKALRSSDRIYKSLIQAADDRIGLFDTEGNIKILNNAFFEKIGYTKEEFLKLKLIDNIHPDDLGDFDGFFEELMKNGSSSMNYRARHKSGHYLHMSSKGVKIKDEEEGNFFLLYIIRNISDLVESRNELIRAKEKAEESDLLKSAFLANVSHEIRTPLNSIVGFANLLGEEGLLPEDKNDYLERINKNSDQLLGLISDIIDLAKIETNQINLKYNSVPLNNIFKELVDFTNQQLKLFEKEHIELKYDPDSKHKEVTFETDLIKILQILHNLVLNAVKFTAEGYIKLGYRIIGNSKVKFSVQDTGLGIMPENYKLIFDQFRQVDSTNTRRYGGAGLGLAISKNLTELLDGKLWVESEFGKGSVFYAEFPLSSTI